MSLPVVFRRISQQELGEAIAWYEGRRKGLGLKLKVEVDELLDRIAANPEEFPELRGSVRRAILRRFPYTIHFLPEVGRIVVLAFFHFKRDPRRVETRL